MYGNNIILVKLIGHYQHFMFILQKNFFLLKVEKKSSPSLCPLPPHYTQIDIK